MNYRLDFDISARPAPDLRVLDGVAAWCGGLHGSTSLQDALKALAQSIDANAAAISRHYHRSEDHPRTVATFDTETGNLEAPVLLRRALCQDVLGAMFERARAATIWFDSDLASDPSWIVTETLVKWKVVRQVSEIVVIYLSKTPQQNDYIEFHFDRLLSESERFSLEALVPTIVRSWTGRKPGLVTQSSADERIVRARTSVEQRKASKAPLLGISNPAGLSRAEFRVCVLVSHGLSVAGVASELGLTPNTVRSHLRAIYAKTDTSCLHELLYRIMTGERERAEAVALGVA